MSIYFEFSSVFILDLDASLRNEEKAFDTIMLFHLQDYKLVPVSYI